jgi:hypothetical protein
MSLKSSIGSIGSIISGPTDLNITDPNLITLFITGAIEVHASTSKFSTSPTTSSTFHVLVSFVHVDTCISSSDDEDDDFLLHCATNSTHHNGIVAGKSGSHFTNLYHALVGLDGAIKSDSYFHVIGFTSLHPFESKEIVYIFL